MLDTLIMKLQKWIMYASLFIFFICLFIYLSIFICIFKSTPNTKMSEIKINTDGG